MPTTRYQPTSPCRTCANWYRRTTGPFGEDCAKGLLMRQPRCHGYEREPGSDDFLDDLGDDDAIKTP